VAGTIVVPYMISIFVYPLLLYKGLIPTLLPGRRTLSGKNIITLAGFLGEKINKNK